MVCFAYLTSCIRTMKCMILLSDFVPDLFALTAINVVSVFFPSSYQMVCSNKSQFSCENLCGNPLPCGNHYCTKTCHPLENRSSTNQLLRSEACENCSLSCQKVLNL